LAADEDDVVLSDEAKLIKMLRQRYEKIGKVARPVANPLKPIKVRLSLMLYQLINVDESEQFITVKLWIHTVQYICTLHVQKRFRCTVVNILALCYFYARAV